MRIIINSGAHEPISRVKTAVLWPQSLVTIAQVPLADKMSVVTGIFQIFRKQSMLERDTGGHGDFDHVIFLETDTSIRVGKIYNVIN